MFVFSKRVASSLSGYVGGAFKAKLFIKSTPLTFSRSFFNGFQGNMGCRGNPVDKKYYELLEVGADATGDDIKSAFRKQAMKHHPDKGGNIEKFKEIKEAYDVLSNEEKRQIYDQLGPDGLQQSGDASDYSNFADLGDIFESIFGGGGGDGFAHRQTRTEDMIQRLPLTLDELYTGVKKEFAVNRNKICVDCKGIGTTKPNAVRRCPRCNGKGFIMQTNMIMGMMAQSRSMCPECSGEGNSINSKDKCKTCRGKKIKREREQMSVSIKAGMDHGQKVILRGAADQDPHLETGDIVFYIDQVEHSLFRRRGSDLFIRRSISLLQSLTGAEVSVDHLNGERVVLQSKEGDLLAPDSVRCVENLGMPIYNMEGSFGKLYVQMQVQYPKGLSQEQIDALKTVLGEQVKKEEVKMEEVKTEEVKTEEVKTEEVKTEEVKTEEVKTEEVKTEEVKEEVKNTSSESSSETPKEVVYSLKRCDDTIYGNKKLWDVGIFILYHQLGTIPIRHIII